MNIGRIWVKLFVVVGLLLSPVFGSSFLTNISWMESPDSLEIRMVFSGDLPEKYRVSVVRDSMEGFILTAAFLGADTSKNMYVGGVVPQWFHVQVEQDRGKTITRLLLPIKQEVPYKAEWKANHFHLVLPNVLPKENPIWKNPWVYLGVGAVTVGGAVLWLTTSKTPTPKDETIAPPDIDLPE